MWKKSVSTLLIFLFTISPAQILLAMDRDSENPYEKFDSPESKYIGKGDGRYLARSFVLPDSSRVVRYPVIGAAALFEIAHRGGQAGLIALYILWSSYGVELKPKTVYKILKGLLVLSAVAGSAVQVSRKHFANSEIGAQLENGTMYSTIELSQNSSLNVSAALSLGFDQEIPPIPSWQDRPNISLPFPNFNFSVPTAPIPNVTAPTAAPSPLLPPALFPVPQLPPTIVPLPDLGTLTPELQELLKKAWEQVQEIANSEIQKANQQGRDFASSVQNLLPENGLEAEVRMDIPTVNKNMASFLTFGMEDIQAYLGGIPTGAAVRAIMPDGAVSGLWLYIAGVGCFLVTDEFLTYLINWRERPRPIQEYLVGKVHKIIPQTEADDLALAKWEKVLRIAQHPAVRIPRAALAFTGTVILAYFLTGKKLNENTNFSYAFNHSSHAETSNASVSNFTVQEGRNFSYGEFGVNLTGSYESDAYTTNTFAFVLTLGMTGLTEIYHTDLFIFIGLGMLSLGVFVNMVEKYAAYKVDSLEARTERQ